MERDFIIRFALRKSKGVLQVEGKSILDGNKNEK